MQPPSPFPIFPRYEHYLVEGAAFPSNVHVRSRLEALDSAYEAFECCRYASMFLQSKMLEQIDFGANNYAKYSSSLDKLLNWSFGLGRKSVFDWNEEDFKAYVDFLLDPPANWTSSKGYSRFITDNKKVPAMWEFHSRWRPFVRNGGRPTDTPVYRTILRGYQVLTEFFKYIGVNPPRSCGTGAVPILAGIPPLADILALQPLQPNRLDGSENLNDREIDWVFDQASRLAKDDDEREVMLLSLANARYTNIPFRSLTRERDSVGYLSQFQRRQNGSWVFVERSGKKNELTRTLDGAFTHHLERYLRHLKIKPRAPLPDTDILTRRKAHRGFSHDRISGWLERYRVTMVEIIQGSEGSALLPSASKIATLTLSSIRRSAKAIAQSGSRTKSIFAAAPGE
ncbi:hypothetical protein LT706_12220 [Pseudomonas syringae pv. syringae]|uniref:hypothetical protein n=1 Tax=Pseudomonas syringae TaxID=317 RepID=UPI00200B9383|nr:hypothetical protein [Pseudomonas syringae]MCK9712288.1 hypothetical protein [Pseudomonas syringae pv. syringae]